MRKNGMEGKKRRNPQIKRSGKRREIIKPGNLSTTMSGTGHVSTLLPCSRGEGQARGRRPVRGEPGLQFEPGLHYNIAGRRKTVGQVVPELEDVAKREKNRKDEKEKKLERSHRRTGRGYPRVPEGERNWLDPYHQLTRGRPKVALTSPECVCWLSSKDGKCKFEDRRFVESSPWRLQCWVRILYLQLGMHQGRKKEATLNGSEPVPAFREHARTGVGVIVIWSFVGVRRIREEQAALLFLSRGILRLVLVFWFL